MQSMKIATMQLSKLVWLRRRAGKLSAAAPRPSKDGDAHKFSAWPAAVL